MPDETQKRSDSVGTKSAARKVLEVEEWSLGVAADGWEAIEKLEAGEYEAVVIDADLPRHSGYGVLTYLRENVGDDLNDVILMKSTSAKRLSGLAPEAQPQRVMEGELLELAITHIRSLQERVDALNNKLDAMFPSASDR